MNSFGLKSQFCTTCRTGNSGYAAKKPSGVFVNLSVIIPTYQRPDCLVSLLDGLAKQTLTEAFEVVVVNDGGSPLGEIVSPFQERLNLVVEEQENSGPARARNRGAEVASGRWLAFIDDDCIPREDWLEEILKACSEHPEAGIGGKVVNLLDSNVYANASQLLVDYLYDYYGQNGGRVGRFFTTNNLAVPAASFHEIGAFDQNFPRAAGEDREFCDRWSHFGLELKYQSNAVVGHAHDLTALGFLRQHFGYGSGAKLYWKLRHERVGQGLRMEPGTFYAGLMTYPIRRRGFSVEGVRGTALFAVAQLANAAGYFLS